MSLPHVKQAKHLEKVLRLVRFATTPEKVDQKFVRDILEVDNDKSIDEVIAFLRDIGFVNHDNLPTDLYRHFRSNSTIGWAVVDALRHAYKSLYAEDEFMHELSDDELRKLVEKTAEDPNSVPLILASIEALKSFGKGAKGPMARAETKMSRTILSVTAGFVLLYGLLFLIVPAGFFEVSEIQEGWMRRIGGLLLIGAAVAVWREATKPILDRQQPLVLALAISTALTACLLLCSEALPVWVRGLSVLFVFGVIGLTASAGLTATAARQKNLLWASAFGIGLIAIWCLYHSVPWFEAISIVISTALAAALAWVYTQQTSERSLLVEASAQVVGSDIESGYTFMYTWLANQFGHFMIGFAGTFLWLWAWFLVLGFEFLLKPENLYQLLIVAGFAISWLLIWLAKEIWGDILPSQRTLKEAKDKRIRDTENLKESDPNFEEEDTPDDPRPVDDPSDKLEKSLKKSLLSDTYMDMYFYVCGALTALAMLYAPAFAEQMGRPWLLGGLPLLTFFALLFLSRVLARKWLWQQIAFDKARLPFVSRFALTKRPFVRDYRNDAIAFSLKWHQDHEKSKIGLTEDTKHLVIIGPPKSGRTSAAVALGVEALLESKPPPNIVRYITFTKLLDRLVEGTSKEATPVFPPEEADLLIVDDVGAQTPARDDAASQTHAPDDVGAQTSSAADPVPLLKPDSFKELLINALNKSDSLRAAAKTKRVIWVVGDRHENRRRWEEALEEAFDTAFAPAKCVSKACTIFLTDPIPLQERHRPKDLIA